MTKEKKEDAKLLDHNYDGIQELDNPLPRWWVNLFIACTLFAIGYVLYFTLGPGLSIQEKFAKTQEESKIIAEESNAAFSLVAAMNDSGSVENGHTIYTSKCTACHGQAGEGGIGPNLTDNYWINGNGNAQDIYDVINNGVVEKGMMAWGPLLSPDDMADLVAYIDSIKGSTPKNAKAPQGQEY